MDSNTMLEFDRKHIWHPYTSMIDPLPVYGVKRAEGVRIELLDGTRLIDGMSSWWCAVHGYNHPVLNAALRQQTEEMAHVMFGGFTHEPAVKLAESLTSMLPENLDRVFYCDSGSVAVEIAIKMALQYMHARGESERNALVTVSGGYHGDTWHAMSVCDPVTGMHSLYHGRLPRQHFVPRPRTPFGTEYSKSDARNIEQLLEREHSNIAAVILEPIVQGAGGMWFYHPQYLKDVREFCDRYGVLLIADEIATGFGRTGKMFGCEWAGVIPDIICLGKALTGGYMSFAATVASSHVADTISAVAPHSFMHGPTFMGNPLACSVANASLSLLHMPETLVNVSRIESVLREELCEAESIKGVENVRVLGAIGVVQTTRAVDLGSFQRKCVERGVWIRPFGTQVYVMPPYIIDNRDLRYLCRSMIDIIRETV